MGMMGCAVQFMTAIDNHDRKGSNFHHHPKDNTYSPVKQPKICEGCGAAVQQVECVTGYAHEGDTVILTDDEKKIIEANSGADIEIRKFVKAKEINPLFFSGEKCYFLVPDMDPKRGGKLAAAKYLTIMKVMAENDWVGEIQYTKWGKTRVALLRVESFEDRPVLMIQNMLWPDELRTPEFPALDKARDVEVDPRLLPVARAAMQSMVEDWNPADLVDTYQEKLTAAIEAKASGKAIELATVEAAPTTDDIADLLAKLEATAKAKQAKAPAKKAPPKKSVA
jgi:DNA end-binding protein Ku